MYPFANICKILTIQFLILLASAPGIELQAREVTLQIRSLIDNDPVENAVVDLQSCYLGKFLSDEEGKVTFHTSQVSQCVLYISSSGFSTLVRPFRLPEGEEPVEMVFYMQKQDQYKTGRVLSENGNIPLIDVHVFKKNRDGSEDLVGISDHLGYFGMTNHFSGQYHLIFRHPSYPTQEKKIFIRRKDGNIGSFIIEGARPESRRVRQHSESLAGISSNKFSFLSKNERYIIILGFYRDEENLPGDPDGLGIRFSQNKGWYRMFTGPYSSEKIALQQLDKIREKYPLALLQKEDSGGGW